jgi:hypothetical protein
MRTGREVAALAAGLVAAAGLAACGSGGGHKGPTPAQDRAAVRDTLVKLERATATHDYATMCNQVLARELIARVAGAGLPCQTAMKLGLRGVRQPHLTVTAIKVSGNRALAQVYSGAQGQKAASDVVQLVRERGAWRVASLAGPQPPAPPRAAG